jgi:polyvinyl alcohol dehydrogenase (cytochrome)
LTAHQAGLRKNDFARLELAWALGFPQTANMRAQPAIVGTTIYLPVVDSGQLFAIDIAGEPCLQWVYQHGVPLRTHVNYGTLADGRRVLVFGDGAAHVQMLEAATGKLLWRTSLRVTSVSNTTGMPVLYRDRVYAPISSGELNMGAAPDYPCCTSHGAVAALDAATGAIVWVHHTMEAATPRGKSRIGTQLWGPSGAPIWTTPAIDERRGVLYVGTGQNTSEPPTDSSDAVLAIDLETGALRWKHQTTPNDIFLTGCMAEPDGPNCPPAYSINKDWDFGASMVLAARPDGSDVLLAGQKNGVLYALDPDQGGRLLWQVKLGPGGPAGGIHWGMAYDGERVYVPVNKVGIPFEDPEEPGLHAVEVATGKVVWSWLNAADCSGDRAQRIPTCNRNYGLSAAALLVDGAVIQGANDGYLRIFDAVDGRLMFQFDTAREFPGINGITAKGGAIDNASVIVANGLLLVQSGYGLAGVPGNALLAFRPRR